MRIIFAAIIYAAVFGGVGMGLDERFPERKLSDGYLSHVAQALVWPIWLPTFAAYRLVSHATPQ